MRLRRILSTAIRGAVAGAVGTVVMDLVQFIRFRRGGGDASLLAWEFGGVAGWDDVSAPGEIADKALSTLMGKEPPDDWAEPAQNVVHWSTGVGWGVALGLASQVCRRPWWVAGPTLGVAAWLTSYTVLPMLGVYKPMWKYDAKTLATDLGVHLAYGTSAAAALGAIQRSSR